MFKKFRLLQLHANYWSLSSFAKYLYGLQNITMLDIGTAEQFDEWRRNTKKHAPLTYWFTNTFLHKLQNIIYYPYNLYYEFSTYLIRRYILRTHVVTTKLSPGTWYDADSLLLHSMFTILVNFIEIEKANMQLISMHNPPWWSCRWIKWFYLRSTDYGMQYLTWEMSLIDSDGISDAQAQVSRTQYELYTWWTVNRPSRIDPHKVVEWPERDEGVSIWNYPPDHKAAVAEACNQIAQIEAQYKEEDAYMMHKLVDIRASLWT
jgi:hypothetical protein